MNRPKNTVKTAISSPKAQATAPRTSTQTMTPPQTVSATPGTSIQPIAQPAPAPTLPWDMGVSPIMQGSLPPIAAGGDNYTRQFYGGSNLPKRRFLPVGLIP